MSDLPGILEALEAHAQNDFRRQALIKMLVPIIEGQRVLDVGCGMGFLTEEVAKKDKLAIALDTEPSVIAAAVKRTMRYPLPASGVNYGGATLPFANGVFQTILAFDVIEHVEKDGQFVQELSRVLVDKGKLIVVVPALQALYGKRDQVFGHYRRYGKKELKTLLTEAHLEINHLRYWNILGLFPYAFSELVLHREISDSIRTGGSSQLRKILAKILKNWLIFESKLYLPIGLSLIAVARKVGSS